MERDSLIRHGIFGGALVVTAGLAVAGAGFDDGGGGWTRMRDPGPETTVSRSVESFDSIALYGAADMTVRLGREQRVVLTGGENMLAELKTEVEPDGTLFIGYDKNKRRGWNFEDNKLEVKIDVETLRHMDVAGAADADISGFDGGDFILTIVGAGDVALSGRCDAFTLIINGAGDVDARDLVCLRASATMNGAGDARINASEMAEAVINGVGDVSIYGDPERVEKHVSGFGDVDVVKSD